MKESERGDFKRFISSEIFYTRQCVVRDTYVYELSTEFQFNRNNNVCNTESRALCIDINSMGGRCIAAAGIGTHGTHLEFAFFGKKKEKESRQYDNNDDDDSCSHAHLIRATFSIHLLSRTTTIALPNVMRLVRCHVRFFSTKIDSFIEFIDDLLPVIPSGELPIFQFIFICFAMNGIISIILWFNLRTNPASRHRAHNWLAIAK